ncbi:aldehyde dehydrogenase family protein [Burkholderia lata]|uniref:Aldehyde dehydrogenase n=1 Tax=Burkholderia lata (strain ATCC 17760 / DSM 23089 / LMG 22485 / NCIMB 9086 / R18194 / 383) TaxID=482957 RepID=A0A6P2W5T7_BURL3|nr:aldehyde dehydrogenase family protein [Burkholderia lata]VWC93216.1 aldehyde dehydrogenase [Burkholderia lata]
MNEMSGSARDTTAHNWIAGEWRASQTRSASFNPATGDVLGHFADADEADARDAIAAAKAVFENDLWRRDRHLRARVLHEIADLLEANRDEMIDLLCAENGKIRAEASFEYDMCAPKLRYAAALALTEYGRAMEVRPGQYSMTLRQPVGVVGVIVPWNSPTVLAIRSIAPALAAGCTVVVKMPAQTALTNARLFSLVAQARHLPAGVVNFFNESGSAGAARLVTSSDVAAVSYTGSTKIGRLIAAQAAPTLKRIGLELGGKTPLIVFDDADLDRVIPVATMAVTTFAGQFCMTGSRLLVQRGTVDAVRARMAAALHAVVTGPASDPASEMGPMIDRANVERVDRMVGEAARYGRIVVRGGAIDDGPLAHGAFMRPALVEVDDPAVPIVQQEVFGPVATLEVFDSEADAIRLANATEYGLAASVWTRDIDRGMRVAGSVDAGTVWLNDWAVVHDEFEEGGFKQSGMGRLNGCGSIDDFVETKHVVHRAGVAGGA